VVLIRRYTVQPSGNSRASLLTSETIKRIHALDRETKGVDRIGLVTGISRKQVARVLAEAKTAEDEAPKPIPVQEGPQRMRRSGARRATRPDRAKGPHHLED